MSVIGYKGPAEGNASNLDEALSDYVICVVSFDISRTISDDVHCVHLSCWHCHLVTFIPYSYGSESVLKYVVQSIDRESWALHKNYQL